MTRKACTKYARTAKLHLALQCLGAGKKTADRLAEAFEAVLAAMSRDGGDDTAASTCWRRMLRPVPISSFAKSAI